MSTVAFPLDAVSGAPEYSGRMLRNALAGLLGSPPAGRPLGAISGVRPGTPATTVSVAGSTCTISPHAGVLDVQTAAAAGPYFYAVGAAETKAVPAAHATYTRWDRVSIQLSDPAEGDGTSTPEVAVVYTAGTPAASPALPAAPARSITLARVVVPQSGGGAASAVWMAPEAGTGDVRWYATESDRTLALPSPAPDTVAVIGSGSALQVTIWDGAAWQKIWAPIESVSIAMSAGYTLGSGGITYDPIARLARMNVAISGDFTQNTTIIVGSIATRRPAASAMLNGGVQGYRQAYCQVTSAGNLEVRNLGTTVTGSVWLTGVWPA